MARKKVLRFPFHEGKKKGCKRWTGSLENARLNGKQELESLQQKLRLIQLWMKRMASIARLSIAFTADLMFGGGLDRGKPPYNKK